MTRRLTLTITLAAIGFLTLSPTNAAAAGPPPVVAEDGMVVTSSPLASKIGVDILREGGNAFDAAAAVGFALAVTFPAAGNIGGGGFMVAYTADGEALALDFREKAPSRAHRDLFLDQSGEVIDGKSLWSPLASGVPGSVDGLLRIWRERGSGNISRRELLQPSIRLAENGFTLPHTLAESLNAFHDRLSTNRAAREIFVRADGRPWKQGDVIVQRDLARTLSRISRAGTEGFYDKHTAEALVAYMLASGGIMSREDLRRYTSIWRPPVHGTFRNFEIVSMPPPSSGGILLIQMLNMLEDRDLNGLGWQSAEYVHLLTEVQRRAYADRAEHMGDSDFWPTPVDALIDKAYARERFASFDPTRATASHAIGPGVPVRPESPETCHYSVVDAAGNAVAVTVTLNASYGSGHVAPGTGFLLNNEMDDFSAKPGVPNLYGLVGSEANAIAPGKRMLSSMTPTIVLQSGEPRYVLGTPGGSTIPTTVLQVFMNAAVFGMDIGDAVAAPRHHSQWLPDVVYVEPFVFSVDTERALERLGHTLKRYHADGYIGRANCIAIDGDLMYGTADPRGGNHAEGYTAP